VKSIQIHLYAMCRPLDDMKQMKHVLETSDIIVFHFGVHNVPACDQLLFQQVMGRVLNTSAKVNREVFHDHCERNSTNARRRRPPFADMARNVGARGSL
jgi:hypothetical protein